MKCLLLYKLPNLPLLCNSPKEGISCLRHSFFYVKAKWIYFALYFGIFLESPWYPKRSPPLISDLSPFIDGIIKKGKQGTISPLLPRFIEASSWPKCLSCSTEVLIILATPIICSNLEVQSVRENITSSTERAMESHEPCYIWKICNEPWTT